MTDTPQRQSPWRPTVTFADRLRMLRKQVSEEGLSQKEMAELVGVAAGSWATWETGSAPRQLIPVVKQIYLRRASLDQLREAMNGRDYEGAA
jgi:DNA-binding XRE family transcriptional regulator